MLKRIQDASAWALVGAAILAASCSNEIVGAVDRIATSNREEGPPTARAGRFVEARAEPPTPGASRPPGPRRIRSAVVRPIGD